MESVVRRLRELGLPDSLIDLEEFRDTFFKRGWVMFVRDRDNIADVHLVQPNDSVNAAAPRRDAL
jgi:hypothetical protein